ncbi:hypothetical protein HV819_08900 [Anaerococcus sp. AGMB00486]|uniref:Aminoglycoside phosphotransferase domain-containing protein n=2 Tax=Anaerococcus TaxID=165779 RepID=A0ABX2NBL6_9FIRM|nr:MULTISPECIES: hypothetical protein [Anaerococcus]MDY3006637.1 hypothetical protein [Anaerococcus porci]MSS78104.1 hypothetical protein [Anaerococcus porci]NVF12092.1 hypothetical protein [Anaerococcus faecalis]
MTNDKKIIEELIEYQLENTKVNLIREKDGIGVYRVETPGHSYVLKYFYNKEFRREISYYQTLKSLNIPTIQVFGSTQSSILLENINGSFEFRLGQKEDFENKNIIKALARWYKLLHKNGMKYAEDNNLYSQWDYLSELNLYKMANKFDLSNEKSFINFMNFYPRICEKMRNAKKTLIYQDFYYTNMVVSIDESKAFMFDYNMLGKGSYISDILNVTYWFSKENKQLFIDEYGGIDYQLLNLEKLIAPFIALIIAMERNVYLSWTQDAKDTIINKVDSYLEYFHN